MSFIHRAMQTKFSQFIVVLYEAILKRLGGLPLRVHGIALVFVFLAAGLIAIEAIATVMAFAVVCLGCFFLYGLALGVKKLYQAWFKRAKAPQSAALGTVQVPINGGGSLFRQFLDALYGLTLQRLLRLPAPLVGMVVFLGGFAGAVILVEAIATVLLVGALGLLTFALYGIGLAIGAGWRAYLRHRASEEQKRERRRRNSALAFAQARHSGRSTHSHRRKGRAGRETTSVPFLSLQTASAPT